MRADAKKKDKEADITAYVLFIIASLFCAVGFALIGVSYFPFMAEGMKSTLSYFGGLHAALVGFGLFGSGIIFSVIAHCHCHERGLKASPATQ